MSLFIRKTTTNFGLFECTFLVALIFFGGGGLLRLFATFCRYQMLAKHSQTSENINSSYKPGFIFVLYQRLYQHLCNKICGFSLKSLLELQQSPNVLSNALKQKKGVA